MAKHATPTLREAPTHFDMVRWTPGGALSGIVLSMSGYRETARGRFRQHEAAALVVPLVVSFDEPFQIALGREPTQGDRFGSFASGPFPGPVTIDSFGASHCLQIDFSPLGARRFFQRPMSELSGAMVDLSDVLGASGLALREQLGNEHSWSKRFEIAVRFVEDRIGQPTANLTRIGGGYDLIIMKGGRASVHSIARKLGWSRKHLAQQFSDALGLGPKAVSRIARFGKAQELGRMHGHRWADIAADCGYADQAHLTREFVALAGESPAAWATRLPAAGNIPSRPTENAAA